MKKQSLWAAIALMMATALGACSNDDPVEAVAYDEAYQISYYDQPPYAKYKQGYWYTDENGQEIFCGLIPNTQPPYTLLVIPKGEKGMETIDYLTMKNFPNIQNVQQISEVDKHYLITTEKYFESPYLYVSDAYWVEGVDNGGIPIPGIISKMMIHMKNGCDISSVESKYEGMLTNRKTHEWKENDPQWTYYLFDCNVKNSYEMLQLTEKVYHLDEVEWAEADMYGVWYY